MESSLMRRPYDKLMMPVSNMNLKQRTLHATIHTGLFDDLLSRDCSIPASTNTVNCATLSQNSILWGQTVD